MSETACPLAAVPSLAQLEADRTLLEPLPLDTLLRIQQQLGHLSVDVDTAVARQLARQDGRPSLAEAEDHLLTAEEAAERLGYSRDWLYKHADALPFTVRVARGRPRFSALGLARYIRSRQGR